jgi:putative hydrolase of the HAD superfamily
VVTDAFKINALARLKKSKLERYFDLVVTADMTGKKKPEPDSIVYAMEKLRVGPNETIFVGDSLHRDIAPAKELGLVTIYAAYGDRNFMEDRINIADFVLQDIRELIDVLKSSLGFSNYFQTLK